MFCSWQGIDESNEEAMGELLTDSTAKLTSAVRYKLANGHIPFSGVAVCLGGGGGEEVGPKGAVVPQTGLSLLHVSDEN